MGIFVIDGNIGSGKSSLLKYLKSNYVEKNKDNNDNSSKYSFKIIEELFINEKNEMDPIIQKFYDNPKEYAFLAQIKILMTHMKNKQYIDNYCQSTLTCKDTTDTKDTKEILIFERSPLSCIHIFGEQLQADNLIDKDQQEITEEMNNNFGWIPENIIYINTPSQECYNRIKKRGRNGEEKIPLDYLKHLENRYNNLYNLKSGKITLSTGNIIKIWILDGNKSTEQLAEDLLNIINSD